MADPSDVKVLAKPVTAAVVETQGRLYGKLERPFEPLIKRVGASVVPDVQALECALFGLGSENAAGEAFRAIDALWKHADGLAGPEGERVRFELMVRWWKAEAMQAKLAAKVDKDAATVIGELNNAVDAGKSALKSGAAAAAKKIDPLAGRTLAELDDMLAAPGVDPELVKLWVLVRTRLGAGSTAEVEAAKLASDAAERVWKVLQGGVDEAGKNKLWGDLVNVRGALGEGVAFADPKVLARRAAALADAQKHALRLGPGHEVVLVSQLEDGLKYADDLEGPDAMILIRKVASDEAIVHTAFQVKTARQSEGLLQTVNDVYREVNLTKTGGLAPLNTGTVAFTLPGQQQKLVLKIVDDPSITRSAVVVNMRGATNQGVNNLKAAGFLVEEFKLGFHVDQMTALAVSVQEAALKAGVATGKLTP